MFHNQDERKQRNKNAKTSGVNIFQNALSSINFAEEPSVVDAFESLLLCQLLSDSHFPSLKVAGLCVSLFTPVQACWKYPCQKQEIRDFPILQSEALVRSLHSSHILNSKPSKSKCQITTSICRTQPHPSDPKWAKSLSDSETSKVLLIVCFCLENSRKSTSVFQRFHIHTVQPSCGAMVGIEQNWDNNQSYHNKIFGKQENTVFFQCLKKPASELLSFLVQAQILQQGLS